MREKSSQNKKRSRKEPKKITQSYLYNSGLYYLQRYAASKAHFKRVMGQKIKRSCLYHNDDDNISQYMSWVDDLIVQMADNGFLDDHAYTKAMTYSLRRRGMSAKLIVQKLTIKGIDKDLAAKVLHETDINNNYDGHDIDADFQAALRFAKRKKIGPFTKPASVALSQIDHEKVHRRSLGQLARAGFGYEIAQRILSMDKSEI